MRGRLGNSGAAGPGRRGAGVPTNFVYLTVGRFAALLLSFLALTVLARRLGPQSLGTLQFALAAFFYVAFATDLGLPILGARDYASGARSPELIARVLGARLTLAAVLVPLLILAAVLWPSPSTGRVMVIAVAAWAAASPFNLGWVLQGGERFRMLGAVEVIAGIAQLVAALLLVHGPTDLVPGAIAVGAGLWTTAVGSWIAVRPRGAMLPAFSLAAFGIVRRALPLGIASLAVGIYYSIDALLLGVMRTPSEVAYYAIAYRIVTPFLVVAFVAATVALPAIARSLAEERENVRPILQMMTWGLLVFGLPAAAGTAILAPQLVTALFGPAYRPAALPLAMLIWSVVIVYANAPFGYLMIARGQHREYMFASIGGALVNTALNVLLIPSYGVAGASVATIVTEAVVVAMIMRWTRDFSTRLLASGLAIAIPPTVVMAIVIWPAHDSLLAIPLGVAAYAVALPLTLALWPAGRARLRAGIGTLRS
jgi:O-antigen/teichoic acid export membrane protein